MNRIDRERRKVLFVGDPFNADGAFAAHGHAMPALNTDAGFFRQKNSRPQIILSENTRRTDRYAKITLFAGGFVDGVCHFVITFHTWINLNKAYSESKVTNLWVEVIPPMPL
jgi:hypothetical protein